MADDGRWNVVSPGQALDEIFRLRSLPALERKLELTCRPLAVRVDQRLWQYIEVANEPEGFGGRFAAIVSDGTESALIEVTEIGGLWIWAIYRDGRTVCASGEDADMDAAMRACSGALEAILEGAPAVKSA